MSRIRRFFQLTALLLAVASVAGVARADGDTIVVHVLSDVVAGVEFDDVETILHLQVPNTLVDTALHRASASEDYRTSIRVAAFAVSERRVYRVTVNLRLGGIVIATGQVITDIPSHSHPHGAPFGRSPINREVTLIITEHIDLVDHAPKVASLESDNDGNGVTSPGDVIRYDVTFTTTHTIARGSTFTDALEPGALLVAGSVVTSHGTVFRGNFARDTDVEVRFPTIPADVAVSITYLARVDPKVVNQGLLVLRTPSSVTTYRLLTDDPDTEEVDDPTVVSIYCNPPETGPPVPVLPTPLVTPPVSPQHMPHNLTIESAGLGASSGAPIFSMQGIETAAKVEPSDDGQVEVVTVALTDAQVETAGEFPFTLTPADLQLPAVQGTISIRAAAETAEGVIADLDDALRVQVGDTLLFALRLLQDAQARADASPNATKRIRADLKSDLASALEDSQEAIQSMTEVALAQAVAAGAQSAQQGAIRNAGLQSGKMLKALMSEIGRRFKKLDRVPRRLLR